MKPSSSPPSNPASTAVPGIMMPPQIAGVQCDGAHIARLIDEHRELVALAAGKQMEICMALGDRDGARKAMKEMNAMTTARQAVRDAGCFFVDKGDLDRKAVQGRVAV